MSSQMESISLWVYAGIAAASLAVLWIRKQSQQSFIQEVREFDDLNAQQQHLHGSNAREWLCLVNPISGNRQGMKIFRQHVAEAFRAAGIHFRVILTSTEHGKRPEDIAMTLDPKKTAGLCILGGDGSISEVVNGLKKNRYDASCLATLPLLLCPVGTGNGLAKTVGLSSYLDTCSIITSGRLNDTVPLDAFEVTFEKEKKTVMGILSISWASIGDFDYLTEKVLRPLGPLRTVLAPILVIGRRREYQGAISFTPVSVDSEADAHTCTLKPDCLGCKSHRDSRKSQTTPSDNSVTINGGFILFLASNVEWIAGDVRAAPSSHINGGLLDLIFIREPDCGKYGLLKMFLACEDGSHLKLPYVKHFRAQQMRLDASSSGPHGRGVLSLDGNPIPLAGPVSLKSLPAAIGHLVVNRDRIKK